MKTYIKPQTFTAEIHATYTLLGTSHMEIKSSETPISEQYLIV